MERGVVSDGKGGLRDRKGGGMSLEIKRLLVPSSKTKGSENNDGEGHFFGTA